MTRTTHTEGLISSAGNTMTGAVIPLRNMRLWSSGWASAFQADEAGSIPACRSNFPNWGFPCRDRDGRHRSSGSRPRRPRRSSSSRNTSGNGQGSAPRSAANRRCFLTRRSSGTHGPARRMAGGIGRGQIAPICGSDMAGSSALRGTGRSSDLAAAWMDTQASR